MSSTPRARQKSARSPSPAGFRRETDAERKYFARIVSLDEIWRETPALKGPDASAAWVAGQQLHLITAAQANAAGLTYRALTTRRKNGLLHRVHHGVYLRGQPTFLPGAREFAAVLACGDDAFVGGGSATGLYGLSELPCGDVEITLVSASHRRRSGIRIHRVDTLADGDRGHFRGIPIVSPALALLQYAATAASDELERTIGEAYALRLTTESAINATIDRNAYRNGVAALRAELNREGGPAWTQREAERRMKLLLRKANLPPARTQYWVAGYPADFCWPERRLIVEVDSFQFHGHRRAFERDRTRDQAHVLAGYRVIRVTWRQLQEEPLRVAATIAAALSHHVSSPQSATSTPPTRRR